VLPFSPSSHNVMILPHSLLVYYCSALNSAHKELAEMMKEQLVLEGRDKQFLLARIKELGGAPPAKKPPPPYQRPKVKNVDETRPNGDVVMEVSRVVMN